MAEKSRLEFRREFETFKIPEFHHYYCNLEPMMNHIDKFIKGNFRLIFAQYFTLENIHQQFF